MCGSSQGVEENRKDSLGPAKNPSADDVLPLLVKSDAVACVDWSSSGTAGISSSSDSSVELHAEKALCIGGRIAGMLITLGASTGFLATLVGD